MTTGLLFVLLAGGGTLARAAVGRRWNPPGQLPLGTLAVNVSGSFGLGLLHGVRPVLATIVGTGALGAYTTFSSFARDVVALVEEGRTGAAAAYVASSCGLAVAAAWLGLALVPG